MEITRENRGWLGWREIEREKGQKEYGKTLKEEKRESVQEMVGETNGGER